MRYSWCLFFGLAGCSAAAASNDLTVEAGAPPAVDASVLLPVGPADAGLAEGGKVSVDGGYAGPDGSVLPKERFASGVVSFEPGECGGFGLPELPEIVLGPPVGGGTLLGGLDVVSLGRGGSIVLSFAPTEIVDGPGADFVVFENAFFAGGDPSQPFAELAEVSVSEDGQTWKTFPCTATEYPYGQCAGWRPVRSSPGNGISPLDPEVAGGDPFDLADVGLSRAKFVRIVDKGTQACSPPPAGANNGGFDLDAVAVIHTAAAKVMASAK
jgi:hypothetical protein